MLSSSPAPSQRLRTSCDLCQELKIKCSQDKPTCERCARQQQRTCIYSPLRRIGRPRKSSTSLNDRAGVPAKRHPQPKKHQSKHAGIVQRPEPQSEPEPEPESEPDDVDPDEAPLSSATTDEFDLAFMDTGTASMDAFGPWDFATILGSQNTTLSELGVNQSTAYSPMLQNAQFLSCQGMEIGIGRGMTPINTSPNRSNTTLSGMSSDAISLATDPWLPEKPCPFLPTSSGSQLGSDRSSTLAASHASSISNQPIFSGSTATKSECQGECYTALPQRLAQFEQDQGRESQPPAMDCVLAAEKDMWALKERLFACRRHIPSRSSILILVLLAEHPMRQLEKLFRLAALLGQTMNQAAHAQWPRGASTTAPGHSSFGRSIACPMPEVKCDILIGDYNLDAIAKERAVKRILRLRIRTLMAWMTELKGPLPRDSMTLGNMLEQQKGNTGLDNALGCVVDDLCRRIEYLQGRIEFAG